MLIVTKKFLIRIIIALIPLLMWQKSFAQNPKEQAAPSQPEQVKLNIMVLDKQAHPVGEVRRDELEIYVDGKKQEITALAVDARPLRYSLLIDRTGSLRSQFGEVIKTARAIINSGHDTDETFLVTFVDAEKINFPTEPASNKTALFNDLDGLYIEGGQSAIVDAVYYSLIKLAEYRKQETTEHRRALILITDGEERGSFYKREQLMTLLREGNTQVFVIGLIGELGTQGTSRRRSPRDVAVEFLTQLATETGGRAFFPDSARELPLIADEIMRSLHMQFIVGYTPVNSPKIKAYHKVMISVAESPGHEKRVALTRAGYMAQPK